MEYSDRRSGVNRKNRRLTRRSERIGHLGNRVAADKRRVVGKNAPCVSVKCWRLTGQQSLLLRSNRIEQEVSSRYTQLKHRSISRASQETVLNSTKSKHRHTHIYIFWENSHNRSLIVASHDCRVIIIAGLRFRN